MKKQVLLVIAVAAGSSVAASYLTMRSMSAPVVESPTSSVPSTKRMTRSSADPIHKDSVHFGSAVGADLEMPTGTTCNVVKTATSYSASCTMPSGRFVDCSLGSGGTWGCGLTGGNQ